MPTSLGSVELSNVGSSMTSTQGELEDKDTVYCEDKYAGSAESRAARGAMRTGGTRTFPTSPREPKVPGILRVGSADTRRACAPGQVYNRTLLPRGGPMLLAVAPGRPKSKKRVSFQSEEQLVNVVEISPRVESPLCEELEPCDPGTLEYDPPGSQVFHPHRYGRRPDLVQPPLVTGYSGYSLAGIGHNRPVRPASGSLGSRILANRIRIASNSSMSAVSSRVSSAPVSRPQRTNSSVTSSATVHTKLATVVRESQQPDSRAVRQLAVDRLVRGEPVSDSRLHRGQTPGDRRTSRAASSSTLPRPRADLLTASPGRVLVRGSPLIQLSGDAMGYSRVHTSPYRQGATCRTLGTLRSDSDSSSLTVTGARLAGEAHDPPAVRPRRVLSAPAVSPRKVYAWQAADQALSSVGLHNSGPFIAQMWSGPHTSGVVDTWQGQAR